MVKAQPDKRVEHVQSGTNTRMGKSEQANENQGGQHHVVWRADIETACGVGARKVKQAL